MVSKKMLVACMTISFVIGALLPYGYNQIVPSHRNPRARTNVYVFRETPQGTDLIYAGNTITDIGEQYARNILGFDNVTNWNATKYIALGNSTIGQTKTKLDTEATGTGFDRAIGTVVSWTSSGDAAYNVTHKFTASGNIAINASALHWSGQKNSNNNCFALASLGSSQSFQNNWNCTIVWVIVYDFN